MIICPTCGAQNRDNAYYCSNCAATLKTTRQCPKCGMNNPVQAKFCQNCAAALRGDTPITGLTGKLAPNTVLVERYKIVKKLGQGGMGAVYMVSDLRLGGKYWAVKEMSDAALVDPQEKQIALQAFQNEAHLLASLRHPNLTQVMDYFEEGGKHYLVMDFISGQTLEEMLDLQKEPFTESLVIDWAVQIGDVLEYLHSQPQPIIFRDLKPSNIMLEDDGKIKLIDFGIARLFKPGKQKDTASFGTAGYAPPEQFGRGQTDARSDIYSLGAMLHQLLTLRNPQDEPFKFPSIIQFNPCVSPNTDQSIQKAVYPDPDERWQGIHEFISSLQLSQEKGLISTDAQPEVEPQPVVQAQTQAVLPVQAKPTTITTHKKPVLDLNQIRTFIKSHRLLISGAAVLLILGLLTSVMFIFDLIPDTISESAALPLKSSSMLFNSDRDHKREVYRLNSSGEVIRVTNSPGESESWNAVTDRSNLLFTSTRDGKREVYRMEENGATTRVTHSPGDSESWSPATSPGGKLLFVSNRDGKREVYRMEENGATTRVTYSPGDSESWSPATSSSGKLLFVSNRDGKQEIYRMDESGATIRVTQSPGDSESWSPASTATGKMVYTSNRDGRTEIYRMDENGLAIRVTRTTEDGGSWTNTDD